MGIQDRDYYREGPSFLDRVSQQGATIWLIAITCGIFFGQIASGMYDRRGEPMGLTAVGIYDPDKILKGEVWRLLTAVFLHGGIIHLFFNMLVLYWAGQKLEEVYGSREFVLFYLMSGIGANIFYLAAQKAGLIPSTLALGASGAVTAAMILFALHFPYKQVIVWFVPMPAWMLAVLFVGFTVLVGMSQGPMVRGGGVAHLAHLGGAICGFLYYQTGIQFTAIFKRREKIPVRPKLRVHSPPDEEKEQLPEPVGAAVEAPARPADEQLEAKLDAVLDKVSKYGQESLTPEEREILFKASELYKKRRK